MRFTLFVIIAATALSVTAQITSDDDTGLPAACSLTTEGSPCAAFENVAETCGKIADESAQIACACKPEVISSIQSCYDCIIENGSDSQRMGPAETMKNIMSEFEKTCPAGTVSTSSALSNTGTASATSEASASSTSMTTSAAQTSSTSSTSATSATRSAGTTSATSSANTQPSPTGAQNGTGKLAVSIPLALAGITLLLL